MLESERVGINEPGNMASIAAVSVNLLPKIYTWHSEDCSVTHFNLIKFPVGLMSDQSIMLMFLQFRD